MDKPLTTSTLKVAQHCIKQAIEFYKPTVGEREPSNYAIAVIDRLNVALAEIKEAIES